MYHAHTRCCNSEGSCRVPRESTYSLLTPHCSLFTVHVTTCPTRTLAAEGPNCEAQLSLGHTETLVMIKSARVVVVVEREGVIRG